MSFSRASLKRFNEVQGCAPPVGYYDPKALKSAAGPAFEKSERFQNDKEFGPSPADFDISSCSMVSGVSMLSSAPPTTGVFSSTPRKKSLTSASSMESLREKKMKNPEETVLTNRVRELEREIKKLLQEKTELNKKMSQKEEDMKKLEGRLQHAQSDRTALLAKVASLEKDIKDVNKSNSVLKNKVSVAEGTSKKRDEKLHCELAEVRKQLEKKEKEISGIKRDIDESVTGLLHDLGDVSTVTDRLNNRVSQLEQSFDDKDVDSTKEMKIKANDKCGQSLMEKVAKAKDDAKKIKSSMEELAMTTERKIKTVKSKLREKYEGTVAKLQQLSEDLKMKEDNLESSKNCTEALQKYGDALKSQNRGLMLIVSHLRQEQWMCEDTIRSLKGEVFALSDENKVYEQQTFESNAELATLMEKIELLEEKDDVLNTNIKNLTEKYHILEQNMEEEQKHNKAEYEKLTAELQVTRQSLQDTKFECETSQKTNKDLIQSLNSAQNDAERLTSELDESKAVTSDLRLLAESRAKEIAERDSLLHETQDRIDSLSQEIALKSSQIDSLQIRLSEAEVSESNLRSQLSDLTGSHKKTVEVYLERIEKLEEEKASLVEKKHSLLSDIDKLVAEKVQLSDNLQSTEKLLEQMQSQHESKIKEAEEKMISLEKKCHQSESELIEVVKQLECQLDSVTVKSVSDINALEDSVSQLESALAKMRAEKEETFSQMTTYKENLSMVTEELNAAMEDVAKLAAEKDSVVQQYEERLVGLQDEGTEEKKQWEKLKEELETRIQESQQHAVNVQETVERLESESAVRQTELSDRISELKAEIEQEKAAWEAERQSLGHQLEQERKLRGHAEEDLVRLEMEKEMEQDEMRDKLLSVRNKLTQAETARASLTTQLTTFQNTHQCTEKNLARLKEDMAIMEKDLRGHLVEAEGQVSRLTDFKNSQAETIAQLEKEKAAVTEERNRLKDEKKYDATCYNERFAVLEENARDQRRLFEELKEDFTVKLSEAKADKASVVEQFELYKRQAEVEIKCLKQSLQQSEEKNVRAEELEQRVQLLHSEKDTLQQEIECVKLSSMQTLSEVKGELVKAENDVAQLKSMKLEQEQMVGHLQEEKRMLSDERNRCVSEYNGLAKELEELREAQQQQEEQALAADKDALMEEIHKWRTLYEELQEKVAPFIEQIDAFEAERMCLLGRSAHAQAEVNKLSMQYAKLLGHQNQKQKIKHIVKLKEENNVLKKEASQLREQVLKMKRQMERSGDRPSGSLSVRKMFDPSKAFQHAKENRTPVMSPLKDGNRK